MKKIWHPYTVWEDWLAGMWRPVSGKERARLLKRAVVFTGDAKLYGSYMQRVIREWPLACEHHLTDPNINRKAWVGHAATCLAIQCPEDVTRSAWGYLSKEQQDAANAEAERAIADWESFHAAKGHAVHSEMGNSGVPYGHTG